MHYLRGHIGGSSTEHLDLLFIRDASRKAKVDDLDVVIIVEEEVLELDISMRDASTVAILNAF